MRIKKIGTVFLSMLFIVSNLTVQTSAKVAVKDTTQAEIKFSMMLLDNLPKPGEKDFEPFLELPSANSLKKSRTETIKDMNGKAKTVKINEAKVYNQIKNQVKKLITKAKNNKELNLPENMRIAKEIYEFINRNVKYNEYGDNPQDAIAVYSQKMGICRGFAALTTLMMRLAGIPSADVGSVYKPGNGYARI